MPFARRPLWLLLTVSISLLWGCGSSSERRPDAADIADTYNGPVALAVAPPLDGRPTPVPELSLSWIHTRLIDSLNRTNGFAGVIPLETAYDEHEGEYLIQPTLLTAGWTDPRVGTGRVVVRVRVTHAPSRRPRLDHTYTATCQRCRATVAQPAMAAALSEVISAISADIVRVTR